MSTKPLKPYHLRSSLSLALLGAGLAAACTGSVDSTPGLDASRGPVDADGQVMSGDAQAKDGGVSGSDGAAASDGSVTGTGDAELVDGQVVGGSDAAPGNDGSVVVLPDGEPVFVAFGSGFWTATSCDRGRSWQLSEESSDREQHGPWSAFGRMAFGNGTFVGATGWGPGGHVLSSSSGLAFGNNTDTPANISGVGYTGSEFVLITGDQVRRSPDGRTWGAGSFWNALNGTNQMRYFRMFAELGVAVASVETQAGNTGHPVGPWTVYSTDGLRTWKEAPGDFSACALDIQQSGDIVAVGSTVLMGAGNGALCRSTDAGKSWQAAGAVPVTPLRDLWSDGQSFYALAAKTVYRLEGSNWAGHGTLDMGDVAAAGGTSKGTTVVAAGAKFFWSDNLGPWQQGTNSVLGGSPLSNPEVRDLVVGHYPRACP